MFTAGIKRESSTIFSISRVFVKKTFLGPRFITRIRFKDDINFAQLLKYNFLIVAHGVEPNFVLYSKARNRVSLCGPQTGITFKVEYLWEFDAIDASPSGMEFVVAAGMLV